MTNLTKLETLLMQRKFYWAEITEQLNKEFTEEEIENGYSSLAAKGYIVNNKRSFKLTEAGKKWAEVNIFSKR